MISRIFLDSQLWVWYHTPTKSKLQNTGFILPYVSRATEPTVAGQKKEPGRQPYFLLHTGKRERRRVCRGERMESGRKLEASTPPGVMFFFFPASPALTPKGSTTSLPCQQLGIQVYELVRDISHSNQPEELNPEAHVCKAKVLYHRALAGPDFFSFPLMVQSCYLLFGVCYFRIF